MHEIKIAIVDDHALFREGIKKVITTEGDIEVTLEASSGKDFIDQLALLHIARMPDLVFLDSQMPDMDGFVTVKWLKAEKPQMKIILFSMFDNYEHVLEMLKIGIHGYISKMADPSELQIAAHMVMEKGFYYSAFIAEKVIESLHKHKIDFKSDSSVPEIEKMIASLTKTERVIITHACTGLKNQEIADRMFLSPATVEVHRTNIFKKLKVNSTLNMVYSPSNTASIAPTKNKYMWEEKNNCLYRHFEFRDFTEAFGFMKKVAEASEIMNHHPFWINVYNKVEIYLSTHVAGNIVTEKDWDLAMLIDTFSVI